MHAAGSSVPSRCFLSLIFSITHDLYSAKRSLFNTFLISIPAHTLANRVKHDKNILGNQQLNTYREKREENQIQSEKSKERIFRTKIEIEFK